MLDKLNKENLKNLHNIIFVLLGCTTVYADKLKKKSGIVLRQKYS